MTRRLAILYFMFVALFPLTARSTRAQAPPAGAASAAVATAPGAGLPQNSFSGSVPAKLEPGVLQLSLKDALARGLKQNLGLLLGHCPPVSHV